MARHHDRDGIRTVGGADGARRRRCTDRVGNVGVGSRPAGLHGSQRRPDSLLKRRSDGIDREPIEGVQVAGEIRTKRGGLLGSSPEPRPGAEVFVPIRDPSQRQTDPVALLGTIAQILASTVAIIVVATR